MAAPNFDYKFKEFQSPTGGFALDKFSWKEKATRVDFRTEVMTRLKTGAEFVTVTKVTVRYNAGKEES